MMQAEEALKKLEDKSQPIPVELISAVIGLLPQILELIGRKSLRKQVELQGKLLQLISQRVTALENKP